MTDILHKIIIFFLFIFWSAPVIIVTLAGLYVILVSIARLFK